MEPQRTWMLTVLAWTLGALFLLTMAMADVAGGNFRVAHPDHLRHADEVFSEIPAGVERTQDLRYVASELNRHFFARYGFVHAVLVGVALGAFYLSGVRDRILHGLLLFFAALTLSFLFYFTPTLIEWGREIDFVPRDPAPPEVARFYQVHTVNVVLEMVKLALILFATHRVARVKRA